LQRINEGLLRHLGETAPGLVLHGGSSVNYSCLGKLADVGVTKINFGSSIFRAFLDNMKDAEGARLFENGGSDNRPVRRLIEADWADPRDRDVEAIARAYGPFMDFVKARYLQPLLSKTRSQVNALPQTVSDCSNHQLIEGHYNVHD
jgi:hypothetical protein